VNDSTIRPTARTIAGAPPKAPRYFYTTLFIFWLPVSILTGFTWHKIPPLDKKAFWRTVFLLTGLTTLMEVIYFDTRIWTFSEKKDRLLGVRLLGIPVEEFIFWFGATPFMLLVYLAYQAFRRGGGHASGQ
jgi:lycopene cyclase domain-containing protein